MELAAGVLVTENLRLVRQLGEGGMGSVWAADHLTLRTQVAVKFIAPELAAESPDMVVRFTREATAAAQIKSPHVVQIFDHGVSDGGLPYITMEMLEGEDLGQRLERVGTLPLEQIAAILTQTCKALGKAHAAGIVHRDVKPDNIFLQQQDDDDEPFVKVLDFGVAKHSAVLGYSVVTATGAMVGTPGYMSPEQILSGKNVDYRSDIWSLGVVAYHAMIGDIPFEGETLGALCVSISRAQIKPPSHVDPRIPQTVDAWMAKALSLDKEARFDSTKALAEAFVQAIAGEPLAAPAALVHHAPPNPAASPATMPSGAQAPHPPYGDGRTLPIAQPSPLAPPAAPLVAEDSYYDDPSTVEGIGLPRRSTPVMIAAIVVLLLIGGGIAVATSGSSAIPEAPSAIPSAVPAADLDQASGRSAKPPVVEPTATPSVEPSAAEPDPEPTVAPAKAKPPVTRPKPVATPDPPKPPPPKPTAKPKPTGGPKDWGF